MLAPRQAPPRCADCEPRRAGVNDRPQAGSVAAIAVDKVQRQCVREMEAVYWLGDVVSTHGARVGSAVVRLQVRAAVAPSTFCRSKSAA